MAPRRVRSSARETTAIEFCGEWLMQDEHLQPQVDYGAGRRRATARRVPDSARGPRTTRSCSRSKERRASIPMGSTDHRGAGSRAGALHRSGVVTSCSSATTASRDTWPHKIEAPRLRVPGDDAPGRRPRAGGTAVRSGSSQSAATRSTPPRTSWRSFRSCGRAVLPAAAEHALIRSVTSTGERATTTCGRSTTLVVDRNASAVDVAFTIAEGKQSVVADIDVEGNERRASVSSAGRSSCRRRSRSTWPRSPVAAAISTAPAPSRSPISPAMTSSRR